MSERQGIEIDYCPQCRGVWLDKGELDKIIERSVLAPVQKNEKPSLAYQAMPTYGYQSHNHDGRHKKKRQGFLSEIFDFD
jgi:Zn-finger nucleic acid-binding protein